MSNSILYLVSGKVLKSYNGNDESKSFSRIVMADCEDDAIILVKKKFASLSVGGVTYFVMDLEANEVIKGVVTDLDRREYF